MPKLAKEIFHDFFYAGPNDSRNGKSHTSYDGNAFYSYYTVVAQKEVAKDGRKVLFISYYSMTSTTSGHLSALRSAMPPEWVMLQFPFVYGKHYTLSLESIRKVYEAELEEITEGMLDREENRHRYKSFASAYRQCCELFKWLKKDTRKTLKMLDAKDKIIDAVEAKREAARQARIDNAEENARKRAEKLKKQMTNIFEEFKRQGIEHQPVGEIAYNLFGHVEYYYKGKEFREALQAWMTTFGGRFGKAEDRYIPAIEPKPFEEFLPDHMARTKSRYYRPRKAALVWVDGNLVKTSMGVSVSVNHVKEAFRFFDSLEDKTAFKGYRIHQYTVGNVTDNTISIGCHTIPMENINELRKILFKEDEK